MTSAAVVAREKIYKLQWDQLIVKEVGDLYTRKTNQEYLQNRDNRIEYVVYQGS
jgi:hypothetical protein